MGGGTKCSPGDCCSGQMTEVTLHGGCILSFQPINLHMPISSTGKGSKEAMEEGTVRVLAIIYKGKKGL